MKKIVLVVVLITMYHCASAANKDSINADCKTHFGFFLGTNLPITGLPNSPGITLGAEANRSIGHNLYLSFQPATTMTEYKIKETNKLVESALLEIPLYLAYKPGTGTLKPTFSVGPNYKLELMPGQPSYFAADAAIGLEKKFKHFNLAPEIRYSYGEQVKMVYFIVHITG